ncbi:CD82 antigen [Folsomia candida]|uniref:Tetraspanin n=1 Tax=Folsomia candida TaxID=158441 RepID=A0A226E8K7_FOLCA|nr:CD82 antigen [Folsomia candida]OXA53201.1 CD82 antigen [Folsomia candida]
MANDYHRRPERTKNSGGSMLFCINLIFAACGIGVFILGVYVVEDTGRYLLFRLISPGSAILTQIASSMLGIGVSVIGSSIIGCSVAARRCSIGWYIACICLVLLAELGLGVLFLMYHNNFGSEIENTKLTATLQTQYGLEQSFTKSFDFAQSRFNCCGVESDVDYDRSEWRTKRLGKDLLYPLTCCPLDDKLSDPPTFLNPVPLNLSSCQSPSSIPLRHRYREGCLSPIDQWFRKQTLTLVGMGLTLLLLQMATLATAICLCRKLF